MSSHHIVRDEQEPAVVIAESSKAYWPLIEQLLGWVPTVLVAEDCINDVLIKGIKIDIVICQKENLEALKENLQSQQPIRFLIKNSSMSRTAVNYLKSKGYKGVNIFGEFDKQKSLIINDQMIAIWHDIKHRYLLSNQNAFQKWVVTNHELQLVQTKDTQNFELENLKTLETKEVCISIKEGKIKINSDAPFWIGESLA